MTTVESSKPPILRREINGEKWYNGVERMAKDPSLNYLIIEWHCSGWVFFLRLLSRQIDSDNNLVLTVSYDVYNIKTNPENMHLLSYLISDVSDSHIVSSQEHTYKFN